MKSEEMPALFKEGEALFAALERETLVCLGNLESLSDGEITSFVARRQEIIAAIQNFDTRITDCQSRSKRQTEEGGLASLEDFKRRMSSVLRRVIVADGLLLALAKQQAATLQAELATISRGRLALHGYGAKRRKSSSSLDRTA